MDNRDGDTLIIKAPKPENLNINTNKMIHDAGMEMYRVLEKVLREESNKVKKGEEDI